MPYQLKQSTSRFASWNIPLLVMVMWIFGFWVSQPLLAQDRAEYQPRHYLYDYGMPPGMVAHRKTLARESMNGYFQPVRMVGPEGSQISVYSEGSFQGATESATTAGMMVGHIYRLKITNIPGHPGKEVYPSVEVIGRLFPPEGQEVRFAIPVHIPLDDLEPAMDGSLVTRVIYLENPRTAMAEQRETSDQPFFDVGYREDPIRVAERFGRPMIIVRVGSRVPDAEELDAFGFGTPPMIWFDTASWGPQNSSPTPGQMDPFQPDGLEILPPGSINLDDDFSYRDSAVRQVSYLEPIQEEDKDEVKKQQSAATPTMSRTETFQSLRPRNGNTELRPMHQASSNDQSLPPIVSAAALPTTPRQTIIRKPAVRPAATIEYSMPRAEYTPIIRAGWQQEVDPFAPNVDPVGPSTAPPVPVENEGSALPQVDRNPLREAPQDWSLDDKGVENRTGLTENGLVQEDVTPAVPEIAVPGDAFINNGNDPFVYSEPFHTQVDSNVYIDSSRLPPWPDELLIDGGDRDLKTRIRDVNNEWKVVGLDSEDTVAHFDTLDGRRIVDASNRVAIYAPRFAAVRKVDSLGRTQHNQLVGRMDENLIVDTSNTTDFSSTTMQNFQPGRHRLALQPGGVENQTRGVLADSITRIRLFDGSYSAWEDLRLVKTGLFDNREKARLAIAIQRAGIWTSEITAEAAVDNLQVIVVDDVAAAQETIHVETELGRPQLRLVKVADTDTALPGEYVEFTIRFDNVGTAPIGNVTIMDNLTPRLAYVEDSAECSLEGNFISEPNQGGSSTLRWEIDKPLETNRGGVIRFRCRVR